MSEQPAALTAFQLADQFGREHTRDEYRGRALLLVAGDRAGSLHIPAWIAALDAAVRDAGALAHERGTAGQLAVVGVADLRGVPAPMRPLVRRLLPRDEQRIVLLDWDGALGTAHHFARGRCTALVVDRGGSIVARADGVAPDAAGIRRLAAAVGGLLSSPDHGPSDERLTSRA